MKELALHLLDLAENGIRAGAKQLTLRVEVSKDEKELILGIDDDGKGMTADEIRKAQDPFYTTRTTRGVGLGIPLLKQYAEMAGGCFYIDSDIGAGTRVKAVFLKDHPDIQPLGDVEGCWYILASSYPKVDIVLLCKTQAGEFRISSMEALDVLGVDNLSVYEIGSQLKRLIRNTLVDICL